jgi:outer membrane protein W
MKKIKFAVTALLGLSLTAFAEEAKPQEHFVIDVGGGFATYSSFIVLGGAIEEFDHADGKCDPPDEVDHETNYAVASLGARYIFTPHVEAGLAASYEYYSSYDNVCEGSVHEMYCRAGDFMDHHLVHVAVEGKFNWFTLFDHFRPYSRVGVGALLEFDDELESVGLPSVQLTPVGLEFLFPYVSVYAELGAGYRGFMSGGIALRI